MPQSVFDGSSYKENSKHFLDGNSVKYQVLVNILEKHLGETILFADVDTIIENPQRLREYVESYRQYDIVYARSTLKNETEYSLGFGMFRSTPETIAFIKNIISKIHETGQDDMKTFNNSIEAFSGRRAMFTFPEIIQTQHYTQFRNQYYVLQINCSNHSTYEMNLFEKLISIAALMDISALVPLIPDNVLEALKDFYKDHHPDHYLLTNNR